MNSVPVGTTIMQNSLVQFEKEMNLNACRRLSNWASSTAEEKRWTNCIYWWSVNHQRVCSIFLEDMFGWKGKVAKTGNENAVKGTVWLSYKRDWNEYVIIWQASANEMLAAKCQEQFCL